MTRVAVSSRALFYGAPARSFKSARTEPRIVRNSMVRQYKTYSKSGTTYWGDSPADTPLMLWGGDAQYFFATTNGVTRRVYGTFDFVAQAGCTYIISFTVGSLTGTMANQNISVTGITHDGGTGFNVTALGRHVFKLKATTGGTATCNLGIGVNGNGPIDSAIGIQYVMLETLTDASRTYPYEYVQPGDARAFPFSHTNTVSSNIAQTPTLGTPYAYPRRSSVLLVGDSISSIDLNLTSPLAEIGSYDMVLQREYFRSKIAIAQRAVAGELLDGTPSGQVSTISARLTAALAEVSPHANIARYGVVILQGGTNDASNSRTFAQMQTAKLAQLAAVSAYGAVPVVIGVPPLDAATAPQQAVIDAYNAWLRTYCTANSIRLYDLYAHAHDGAGNYKTVWTSDGIHPSIFGTKAMGPQGGDLIMTIPD